MSARHREELGLAGRQLNSQSWEYSTAGFPQTDLLRNVHDIITPTYDFCLLLVSLQLPCMCAVSMLPISTCTGNQIFTVLYQTNKLG